MSTDQCSMFGWCLTLASESVQLGPAWLEWGGTVSRCSLTQLQLKTNLATT